MRCDCLLIGLCCLWLHGSLKTGVGSELDIGGHIDNSDCGTSAQNHLLPFPPEQMARRNRVSSRTRGRGSALGTYRHS